MIERPMRLLEEHPGLQFLVALTVITIAKWHALFEPPVWDAAMGLFPAALTLAGNNFNLLELLGMPSYLDGGPNTHSTSPVTLITALVLRITGGGGSQGFVVLHLLHFAAAAWALVALFGYARPVFGRNVTALYCLTVLLFPAFSTQVGYMYFEIPLFLCVVSALRAWTDQRFWPAVLWATAAFAVKETGIIVIASLVIAAFIENRRSRLRLKRTALIVAPFVILHATVVLLGVLAAPASSKVPVPLSLAETLLSLLHYLDRWVFNVPDLWALFVVFIASAAVVGPVLLEALRREPTVPAERSSQERAHLVLGYSGIFISLFIGFFLVFMPVVYRFPFLLPRYSVVVAPFLLLWFGYVIKRFVGPHWRQAPSAGFAILAIFFAVNTNGILYPEDVHTLRPGNDFALTERSNAYRRLLALEVQALRAVQALPDGVPVYYGQYEHYLLNYPGLGFAEAPLSNGHNLYVKSLDEVVRDEFIPPCIYALYNYPGLGGDRILQLIEHANAQEGLSSEIIQEFRDGRYAMTLVRIQRDGAQCPR